MAENLPGAGRARMLDRAMDSKRRSDPEQAARYVRDCLYLGPVYQKLYALRQRQPELSYDLDELAAALRQMGDRLEEFVREQASELTPPDRRAAP
jgi:hypothetical protein